MNPQDLIEHAIAEAPLVALMWWLLDRRIRTIETRLAVWASREAKRNSSRPPADDREDTKQIALRYREEKRK